MSGSGVDRRRLAAHFDARAGRKAAEVVLPPEALEQVVDRAAAAVARTRKFALACACGTGGVAGALFAAGVPVLGVDVAVGAVRAAAALHRHPPAAMFAAGATEALPFRDATFGAVVDVGAFHQYESPEAVVAEWARVLAPGGAVAFADVVEKDQDEGGLFSAMARLALPGLVNVHYKPFEIEYFLSSAGLVIESASYYRLKRSFADLEAEREAGAGTGYRALVAEAPPALRELYEVGEEGMVCRFLAVTARKPA